MVDYGQWLGPLAVVLLVVAVGYLVVYPLNPSSQQASTQATSSAKPFTVDVAFKAGIGFYLVNASGFTLYFRTNDPGNGSSTCTGGCVTVWPLFNAGSGTMNLPPNLTAGSFGHATRTDGKNETTFNGYPLYYYDKDKAPGQVNGEGKGNFFACCSVVGASTTSTSSSTTSKTSTTNPAP
jgi:predicted lipoprotein with Yx(FWY)xxD motif